MADIQLRLNSLENTRKTYARILRLYAKGGLDRELYRDLIYGLTGFLAYWKTEKDLEIEGRIAALEAAMRGEHDRIRETDRDDRAPGFPAGQREAQHDDYRPSGSASGDPGRG